MKLITLIILAVCQIVTANTYPEFTSASNLFVQSEVIRLRVAPFYGELSTNITSVENIRTSLKQYSIAEIFERTPNNLKPVHNYIGISLLKNESTTLLAEINSIDINKTYTPRIFAQPAALGEKQVVPTKNIAQIATVDSNKTQISRTFEQTSAFDRMQQVVPVKNIAEIATVDTPDPFSIRLEFDWNEPHGQWMNQLLTDIKAAKQAGDTETYKKLTAQYSAWADQYLIKGTAPMVME